MLLSAIVSCVLATSAHARTHSRSMKDTSSMDDPLTSLMGKENDFIVAPDRRAVFGPADWIQEFPKTAAPGESYFIGEQLALNPILATLPGEGMGFGLIELAPCSLNRPHVHPRATEWIFVIEGKTQIGVVQENGAGAVINDVPADQGMILPQGLLHYQFNDNCEPVKYVASFDNRDPGTITMTSAFLELPDGVLRANLGIHDDTSLELYKTTISELPGFPQDPVCMRRCGIE